MLSMSKTYPHWVMDDSVLPDPHGKGERAVRFLNALHHPKSTLPKKAFDLSPWMERIVRRVYGDTDKKGERRIKTVFTLIPRGNRKTTLASAIELLHVIGPERVPNGLAVSIANDRDQSRLTLEEMIGVIREDTRLVKATKIQSSNNRITHIKSGAQYRSLSADASTSHGRTPVFAFCDETHLYKNRELYDAVKTGLNKTAGSLMWVATTAGVGQTNIGWEMYDYARRVADGSIVDETFLPILFQAPDDADWRDEKVWIECNPGLSCDPPYPDIIGLGQYVREAEFRPAQREVFRRLHLNQWLDGSAAPAFDLAVWDEGNIPFDLADLEGAKTWIGVDLSKVTDLTAVTAAIQMPGDDNRYALHVRSFAPEEGIRKRSDVDHVPYVLWREQGYLTACPGDTVDLVIVESAIRELCELFDVQEISFDRWSARGLMDALAEDGLPVVEFPQNIATFAAPVIEFEKAIFERRLVHGGNPILRWCIGNLVFMTDASGNRRPHKGKSTDRIDCAVASIMAVGRAAANASVSSSYVNQEWANGLVFA